jgi:hypothetical protein
MHWFGEEANTNRTEFVPDATALAKEGVLSLLPQGHFPWGGGLSGEVDEDEQSATDQVIDLRVGLDVLQKEAGDVPVGLVGHDYGAMFGSLLVADGRPGAGDYDGGHELDAKARADRLAWLREKLDL